MAAIGTFRPAMYIMCNCVRVTKSFQYSCHSRGLAFRLAAMHYSLAVSHAYLMIGRHPPHSGAHMCAATQS
eukprot:scaffold48750_cov35-Tisochrysis_lutea.AAC.1